MKLCLCDWTGSGLPDLLVGTHRSASVPPGPGGVPRHDINQATVLLLQNVGRPGEPAFAPPRYVLYRGKPHPARHPLLRAAGRGVGRMWHSPAFAKATVGKRPLAHEALAKWARL